MVKALKKSIRDAERASFRDVEKMNSRLSRLTGKQASRLCDIESIVCVSGAVVFRWRAVEGWPVEFVTQNVKQLLGYTEEDFMSGRVSWPGITHPDDVPRLEAEVASFLKQGSVVFSQEYRLLTKTGEVRWVEDRNMVIMDSAGAITHVQGIVFDVSKRKQIEYNILDATNRYRQRLGDDIRETLTQQLAGASYLAASLEQELAVTVLPLSSAASKLASVIRDSLCQALTMVRGLSLAGLQAEGLAFGLKQLASATQYVFGVPCECVIPKPVRVHDDALAVQLYHIAQDAVDLAIRHGSPGNIVIHLATKLSKGSLIIEYDGVAAFDETRNIEARLIRCRAEMIAASLDVKQNAHGHSIVTCLFDLRRKLVIPSAKEDPLVHLNEEFRV